jgi:hypothetical protein
MLREQREIDAVELAAAASGDKVPQTLKSARRAGLLESDILGALGIANNPLVRGALRSGSEVDASA